MMERSRLYVPAVVVLVLISHKLLRVLRFVNLTAQLSLVEINKKKYQEGQREMTEMTETRQITLNVPRMMHPLDGAARLR